MDESGTQAELAVAEVERPDSCPQEGVVAPFDAGWFAHEIGLDRETVSVLAVDRSWALLGYDARATASTQARMRSPKSAPVPVSASSVEAHPEPRGRT